MCGLSAGWLCLWKVNRVLLCMRQGSPASPSSEPYCGPGRQLSFLLSHSRLRTNFKLYFPLSHPNSHDLSRNFSSGSGPSASPLVVGHSYLLEYRWLYNNFRGISRCPAYRIGPEAPCLPPYVLTCDIAFSFPEHIKVFGDMILSQLPALILPNLYLHL